MELERVFLDWSRPVLPAAAEDLARRYSRKSLVDLGGALVVLASARARRRFVELLLDEADALNAALAPPRFASPTELPALLLPARFADGRRPAPPAACRWAWCETLRRPGAADLVRVLPHSPAVDDHVGWARQGALFQRVYDQLSAARRSLDDLCEQAVGADGEIERWAAFRALAGVYRRRLADVGLVDPYEACDLLGARSDEDDPDLFTDEEPFLDADVEPPPPDEVGVAEPSPFVGDVVLLAPLDLPPAVAHLLDHARGGSLLAYAFGPEQLAHRFDRFGRPKSAEWRDDPLPLSTEQMRLVGGPVDQAAAGVAWAREQAAAPLEDLTIGCADDEVLPYLEQQAALAGLPLTVVADRPLVRTAPYRLLRAVAEYLDKPYFHSLAALVRHPDLDGVLLKPKPTDRVAGAPTIESVPDASPAIVAYVSKPGGWLTVLDDYHAKHLQAEVGREWPGAPAEVGRLRRLADAVDLLLGDLRRPAAAAKPTDEVSEGDGPIRAA
ncbi:MAG: hypothetical protein ACRC1K_06340, partial [Planctomycetia bacterium]